MRGHACLGLSLEFHTELYSLNSHNSLSSKLGVLHFTSLLHSKQTTNYTLSMKKVLHQTTYFTIVVDKGHFHTLLSFLGMSVGAIVQ